MFEQKITVGNLVEALSLIKGDTFSSIEFHDEESGHCRLSLFAMAPYVGKLSAPMPSPPAKASTGDDRGYDSALKHR